MLNSVDPEDYIDLIMNSKMGMLTIDRLSPVHAVALAHGLSMTSNREAPILCSTFIFALGTKLVKGWAEMPLVKQAAAAAALSSTANAIQKIRDFAELVETKGSVRAALATGAAGAGAVWNPSGAGAGAAGAGAGGGHAGARSGAAYRRKLYILLMHDEGADKKKANKLLVYGVWRNADGTLSRPVLLGCLDCSKTGAENARVIKERLAELGLGLGEVVVLGQTVDGAGTKTVNGLEELGLLFTIICECHCVNKIAQQYEAWVGAPSSKARNHPVTLLFNVTYLIRRLVKITSFFEIAALAVRELFVVRGGNAKVAEQLIVGAEIQSLAQLVDGAERVRWASVEKGAANVMAPEELLDRTDPRLEPYLRAEEVTLRGVIVIALHKLFTLKRAYWFTKPSKDRLKYGSVPLVVKTKAELEDPQMLCHLALLSDVYPLIAKMLALARGAESRGGGGADLLTIRRWGLEQLMKLTVASLPTLPSRLAALRLERNGEKLVESFERGANLYFSKMVEKRKEHLRRSQTTNFVLSLADPYMAEASVELLIDLLIEEGILMEEVNDGHDRLEPERVFAPFDIPLVALAQDMAAECKAAIKEGGGLFVQDGLGRYKIVWVPSVLEHVAGLLEWRSAGCPVSPSYEEPFVDLLVNGLQVARRSSMEVELGVGDLAKADRAVARSFLTAVGQQGRLILFSAARRMRRAGRNAAPAPVKRADDSEVVGGKRAKKADDSEVSYEDPTESKVVHMFVLLETANFVESIGSSVVSSAKDAAKLRRYTAERSRTEACIVKKGIEQEIERAAAEDKADTFEAQVAAARDAMSMTNDTARTYFLLNVEARTREYLLGDMARTYAVHLHCADPTIDVNAEAERLANTHTKSQLRVLLTDAFFNVAPGESWVTKFLPMPGLSSEDQIRGINKAKEMSTPQMVAAGTAWAWKV